MTAEEIACGPEYPYTTYPTLALTSILCIFISVLATLTFIRLRQQEKSLSVDYEAHERQFSVLYYVQLTYLCLCAITGLVYPVISIVLCTPSLHNTLSSWTMNLLGWCTATMYYYHWDGFIAILFLRLQVVFKGPVIDGMRYRGFNCISITILCIITLGYTLYAIMYITSQWTLSQITLIASSLLLLLMVYSQALAFVFVRRLYQLNALAERDDALIAAMTKMSLIALTSIIGSIVLMFGLMICGLSGKQTPMNFVFVSIGSVTDVLLDTLFVSLSLKTHEKYYLRLCGKCDARLRRCCVKLTDRTTRKKELELAAAHQDSAETPDAKGTIPTNSQESISGSKGSTSSNDTANSEPSAEV